MVSKLDSDLTFWNIFKPSSKFFWWVSSAGSVDLVHFSLKCSKIEVFGHFFIEKFFFKKKFGPSFGEFHFWFFKPSSKFFWWVNSAGSVDLVHFSLKMLKKGDFWTFFHRKIFFFKKFFGPTFRDFYFWFFQPSPKFFWWKSSTYSANEQIHPTAAAA